MSNRPDDHTGWRAKWYDIIFEAETREGRLFDILLLVTILGSIIAIMLESVDRLSRDYQLTFHTLEWFFTIVFTVEYIMRLAVVKRKRHYIFSFYGIIDLLSFLPTYLAIVLSGAQYFFIIRSLRLLRMFRVLKMVRFLGEAQVLMSALRASRIKITVFLVGILCVIFIMGTVMYVVEGPSNGFTSIPTSIYWCIVTLTTVGYGDISPQTPLGQAIASMIMILGYGIIAVPTGIVTSEMTKTHTGSGTKVVEATCSNCGSKGHTQNAVYCKNCGEKL